MNDLTRATAAARSIILSDGIHGNAHWWFAALDQRWFSIGAKLLLTHVVGVHVDGSDVWIQLQSLGEDARDFTICARSGMSVADVIKAIETQIRQAV